MQTTLQTVTPRQARQWLDLNYSNRPLSRAYVEELARALRSGQFHTTHQGLAFDTQGRLRDGQHRLTAIVETGIAAELLVSTGLTETELRAIDASWLILSQISAYSAQVRDDLLQENFAPQKHLSLVSLEVN